MAITQTRLISILSAARRFYNFSAALKKQVSAICAEIPPGATEAQLLEAIQAIQFLAMQNFATEEDLMLLATEERHFETNFKKNKKLAEYARRKRAGLGPLGFSKGKASKIVLQDIDDEAKEIHYANAEKVVGLAQASQHPTAPIKLHKAKPLDSQTTRKPSAQFVPLSDAELGLSKLAIAKFKANELKIAHKMKPDYLDPTDDSEPLTPDDARVFGFETPDEELF